MEIADLVSVDGVVADLKVSSKKQALQELSQLAAELTGLHERAIFDTLRRLRASHTMLVIAHRLSTVRDATRILVLDGGRLIAQGPHHELIRTCDLYRRMCARLSIGQSLDDKVTVDELLRPPHENLESHLTQVRRATS